VTFLCARHTRIGDRTSKIATRVTVLECTGEAGGLRAESRSSADHRLPLRLGRLADGSPLLDKRD
jgi:hypothetical protein